MGSSVKEFKKGIEEGAAPTPTSPAAPPGAVARPSNEPSHAPIDPPSGPPKA
jgi:hypothetical protein